MANLRFKALEIVESRKCIEIAAPSVKVSEYFGQNVFDDNKMRSVLPENVYKNLKYAIYKGEAIAESIADAVAGAMKNWAVAKGATHYAHWFLPLTNATAEKHDSFFNIRSDGQYIEEFKGSGLVKQEPDASSFPSGGLRNTFEARGYTAWDPTCPAFIMESGTSKTLCIPTIFVSHTGKALDNKAPLLKSLEILDKAAIAVCDYFDKSTRKVYVTLGCEQEFFLIDKALYNARPDLMVTGRTVFGRTPPKGQQLEDHYFGSIPSRVKRYLQELEIQAYKLGIPIKTKHNEVAPSQFECTPIFEEANLAIDHNQMLMDLMKKVANKHQFKVLFHEKPFADLNGSGKHNNWSMYTDTKKNLLAPSSKAKENLQFLTFFVNTIMAVYEHADLLRASIASAGNDYRLGANEAPPAIISVFIGEQLTKVLHELEHNAHISVKKGDNIYMKLGVNKIPPILLDNTDRNRTSPFAFTGNKFELRAVGASANSAVPITVLNTIVAQQLQKFKIAVDKQIKNKEKKEVAIINILRDYTKASKKIRFEGNNYSAGWVKDAEKRKLKHIEGTPSALDAYLTKKSIILFEKTHVLSKTEVEARHEVMLENYVMEIQIESRMIGDLALNHIVPTAIGYQNKLIQNVRGLKEIGLEEETKEIIQTIQRISRYVSNIKRLVFEMIDRRKIANKISDTGEKSLNYESIKNEYFDNIRRNVDRLELVVDDADWPLPKYRELLFLR